MKPTRESSLLADCQAGGEEMNDAEIEQAIIAAHGSGLNGEDGYDIDRAPRTGTGQARGALQDTQVCIQTCSQYLPSEGLWR